MPVSAVPALTVPNAASPSTGWLLCSSLSPRAPGIFPESCCPGRQCPAWTAAWGSAFPGAGLNICPGCTAQDPFLQPAPDLLDGSPAPQYICQFSQFGVTCQPEKQVFLHFPLAIEEDVKQDTSRYRPLCLTRF